MWFISFPEGSRFSAEKQAKSAQFCKENNYPPLKNVLFPRSKGFLATVNALRDSHVKYFYDVTIAYYHPEKGFGQLPTIMDIHLFGVKEKTKYFIHIKKYSMDSLPKDDAKLSTWLFDRFYEKDPIIAKWKDSMSKNK